MRLPGLHHRRPSARVAFTLVELLITIMIIAIMAGMVLFALYAAQEQAREQKTRALVAKLDAIIKAKYESYRTRRVPITLPANAAPAVAAKRRLDAIRDLMRMEMPDRWTDVTDAPVAIAVTTSSGNQVITRPAVNEGYLRRYNAGPPSLKNQAAECLYMIVMAAMAEDGDSRETFRAGEIGDYDNDGFPEFHDAWGSPIRFLRWAPAFDSEVQVLARVPVQSATPDTVTGKGLKLSKEAGAYVGGVVVAVDRQTGEWNKDTPRRIIGYEYIGNDGEFKVKPSFSPQPSSSEDLVVLAPDPFDPRGVSTELSWAVYPLIYSGGPDKIFEITSDTVDPNSEPPPPDPHSYADNGLEPCFIPSDPTDPLLKVFGTSEGRGSVDNIHNHRLGN